DRSDPCREHAGNQKILPYRQPDITVAEIRCNLGEAVHLDGRHLADRKYDPDPVQSRLLLRAHPDMSGAVEGRALTERLGSDPGERGAKLLFDQAEEFIDAQAVEHVFEPRLGSI